ncbi:hypothetical protein QFZ34_002471 [Phyllobacterium ifriqiyense]|uniref:Uncharacterized protein n=1 Tax=Phyllobacterium ifriqiyense TaxID=314238 RepID=A0ABU0S957_9HYPH|nr:hypothetical protein [Phyllobacterium ifriqiyense]
MMKRALARFFIMLFREPRCLESGVCIVSLETPAVRLGLCDKYCAGFGSQPITLSGGI